MNLPYIINVAVILLACLAFYKLLLRRETFYTVNRYMLIVCLVISFALPLLQVPAEFSLRKPVSRESLIVNSETAKNDQQTINKQQPNTINNSPVTNNSEPTANKQPQTSNIKPQTILNWLFWIYWFGVILFGVSFLFQLVLLLWRAYRNPVIIDGPYRIVEVSGDKAPCSFGNNIFINPEKYEWETYNQILLHEKIHISQHHTLDIIIAELLLIFQWFNPFAWIYRREIESNLEFLTDDQLMQQKKVDKQRYQLSLVQVSAPHFPFSLTTNYNQSILKKRIAMMNTKRSNLHTAWKYFFLLPVFAFLACLLNEPVARGQTSSVKSETNKKNHGMETGGYWFAIIKDDKVNIRFSDEKMDDEKSGHSFSGDNFKLSELGTLPKGSSGTFNITREAGKMQMTGKFEGNTGMGTYKFVADKAYVDHMNKELKENLDDDDQMAFFFINIKKDYLQMLQKEGFTNINKGALIPMASMNFDAAYINSFKAAGLTNFPLDKLVAFKAVGVTPEYIQSWYNLGFKDIIPEVLVGMKSQNVTPEYMKLFTDIGYKNIRPEELAALKIFGITPEYIKSFETVGFKNIDIGEIVAVKQKGVTPEYIKEMKSKGFNYDKLQKYVTLKSTD